LVKHLFNLILEGIPFSKFIVVVLSLISFLEVHVVLAEEVVVVLRTDHLILQFFLYIFVRVKEGGLVLSELIVIIFVVEIVGSEMGALGDGVAELFQNFLETCAGLALLSTVLREGGIGVDVEKFDLLCDVVHGFLEVALFSVGGEVQRFKGGKSSHKLLIG
jgi:hypothetical protein